MRLKYCPFLPNFKEIDMPRINRLPCNVIKLKSLEQVNFYDQRIINYSSMFKLLSKIDTLRGVRLYEEMEFVFIPKHIGLLSQVNNIEILSSQGYSLPKQVNKLNNLKRFGFVEYIKDGLDYLPEDCEKY